MEATERKRTYRFYWRHNDKIYAALGDSAVLIKYVKPMEDVDIATFYVNKETTNGMENYAKDKKNVYYPLHAICVDADSYGYEYATELIVRVPFPLLLDMSGMGKELMGIRGIDMVGEKTSEGVDKLTSCL